MQSLETLASKPKITMLPTSVLARASARVRAWRLLWMMGLPEYNRWAWRRRGSAVCQLNPCRCVIARFLHRPNVAFHAGRLQPLRQPQAQEQMADPDPVVPRKRIPEIVPEGGELLFRVDRPEGVRPTLSHKLSVGFSGLGEEQSVAEPAFRPVGVLPGGMTLSSPARMTGPLARMVGVDR
jgi:hypothetical protein